MTPRNRDPRDTETEDDSGDDRERPGRERRATPLDGVAKLEVDLELIKKDVEQLDDDVSDFRKEIGRTIKDRVGSLEIWRTEHTLFHAQQQALLFGDGKDDRGRVGRMEESMKADAGSLAEFKISDATWKGAAQKEIEAHRFFRWQIIFAASAGGGVVMAVWSFIQWLAK